MTFIYQDKDVVTFEWLSDFVYRCHKFINDCCHNRIAFTLQQLNKSLARCCIFDKFSAFAKCPRNLIIEISTIGYKNNFWIFYCGLHGDRLSQHDHCEGFSTTLCVPDNSPFASPPFNGKDFSD
ncbi:hypothetical protein SDC9_77199 [bioreactor metagenome]|uniref:Uncharacterized protein n=1 Tax=bioreactor metagenome TaxID=1076179 RepID=A0A644YQR2_9ZZZZ